MARKLENCDFRIGTPPKYPWDQWLDGSIWELTHGVDFFVSVGNFRVSVRYNALARGMGYTTKREGNKLIIQAYEE